ncbi:response regulator transcription factor [Streptomyces sp. A0958]|uniref:response regulator transcription factor n=1 Tax=Streptomyces sp. A0958 TaxID=2563101 RepID=UPI00109E95D3|nr:response regulator transcription factor [Streptomyces sp. A0958]THA63869.1 response regulator transcription factor [Streptomyces sp. A0958]
MNASNAPGPDADPSVTVLIVDDDELTRTGLRTLLSAKPDLDVVGEATDGAEVVAAVTRLRPDVVLMDVRMPRVDGIEATRRLRALPDPPKVVVITTFEYDEHVWDALRAGASGFIRKRAPAQQIAHAIRLVTAGDSVLFPEAVRRMAVGRPVRRDASPIAALTGRETETLRLMARGLSNQEIAARLVVSLETVKTHVGNVLAKLGVGNRTQAVVLAFETGVADPGARFDPDQPTMSARPG